MFTKIQKILAVAFLLGGVWFGYWYHEKNSLDESSSGFASTAALSMLKHWDFEELKTRAHPELYDVAQEEEIKTFFSEHASAGRIQRFEGCKGNTHLNFLVSEDNIPAEYSCRIIFEKDQADISIRLRHDDQSDWKITGIAINTQSSPPGANSTCCLNITPKE